jgi:predicted nucleic acid-binding protein
VVVAYLDTSLVVALAFGEPRAADLARRLGRVDRLCSSTLLEAELLAAAEREGLRSRAQSFVEPIHFVFPDRRLSAEIDAVLAHGYVRGADLHHLATALFVFDEPTGAFFLTLDARQEAVAGALGFSLLGDLS